MLALGLKATAEIYAAHTESEAYELVKRHGVSHIAIFSSDAFSQQYTRLIRGLPFEANPQDAFIPSLLATSVSPRWLKPIHFLPPTQLASETLILMEIKLDQTLAEAHYSVSEYLDARGQAAGSILELQKALTVDPNYREAWFRLGSMKLVHEGVGNAKEAIEKGLAGLTPKEASSHCEKLAMKFFQASRHAEAVYMLRRALEALPGEPDATNALAWVLATSYIDAIRDPAEALTLAEGNDLNPSKSAYFDTLAAAQAVSGKVDEAIATQSPASAPA